MTEILKPIPADIASVPQIPAAVKAKIPESLAIKYYPVELPSKGRLGYPAEMEYRDILVRDEKILAASTADNYIKILHKVLKSLLKNPEHFDDLTVFDRDYLLVWIWANCYSPDKEVEVQCPNCDHKFKKSINLTKLKVDDVSPDIVYPFQMTTSTGEILNLKLFTIGVQEATGTYMKEHPESDFDTVACALSCTVEGRGMPPHVHIKWVEDNIRGKDFALVRAFHEHYRYGVDENTEITCPACSEVSKVKVPFQPEWLRPSDTSDFSRMLQSHIEAAHQSD